MKVFLLILFLNAQGDIERHYTGGAGSTAHACQQVGAELVYKLREEDAALKGLKEYIVCIDVGEMGNSTATFL